LIARLRNNPMVESMAHFFGFQREYWRNREQTGSVKASSPSLARAMVQPFWDGSCPQHVLEVGSGTGAISAQIFRQMQPDDKLTIVEINRNFLAMTRRKMLQSFGDEAIAGQVSLINADFLHNRLPADSFSRICCSLPFNNFAPRMIGEIFHEMLRVCRPGGIIVFYEYILLRRIRYWLSLGQRKDLKEIEAVLSGQIWQNGIEHIPVFANAPPAMVYVLRKPKAQTDQ
jgi:phosphatidylethanolamine/phosphatidyl-N-methylethanolamine N-methyltransferase